MKPSFLTAAFLLAVFITNGSASTTNSVKLPDDTEYSIVERGANHCLWEKVSYEPGPDGKPLPVKHRYTELASGLNYQDVNGQWHRSEDVIESYSGGAVARHGQYQVIFANNLNSYGAIDMQTLDGKRLRSNILGLMYHDIASDKAVLIAQLQDTEGELISSNQVLYPDAFNGVKADVRYSYKRGSFEQDVILREQPPAPESYGLDPDTTELEVMTEFINPPEAQVTLDANQSSEEINWGATRIGRGKAFDMGNIASKTPVEKKYVELQGRYFLLEKVKLSTVESSLSKLPLQSSFPRKSSVLMAQNMVLPATPLKATEGKPIQLAASTPSNAGYVLDYVIINSSHTDFVFQRDTTYYVSGEFSLSGTTTIEGGTIIKMNSNGQIDIDPSGSIDCLTASYRPAVFTSQNDNTIGQAISGSSGSPSLGNVNCFLDIGAADVELSGLRFSYSATAVKQDGSNVSMDLRNCQFEKVNTAAYGYNLGLYNVLIGRTANSNAAVVVEGPTLIANNVTADYGYAFIQSDYSGATLAFTNCLVTRQPLIASGYSATVYTNCTAWVQTPSGPIYRVVGAGSYYLTNDSPYRDAGTTNLDSESLSDIQARTTYPPIVYSNVTISVNTTLGPQAQRDTDDADLGYHYDPLDYVFGSVTLNSNLTFTAGTAVGYFVMSSGAGYGIMIYHGSTILFDGNLAAPCYLARYNNIQECGNGNWTLKGWLAGIAGAGSSGSTYPTVAAQFTIFSSTANTENFIRDYYCQTIVQANSCEFYSGILTGYGLFLDLTNDLFDRITWLGNGTDGSCGVAMRNCTMYGGGLYIQHWNSSTWPVWIENCAFDGVDLSTYMTEYSGGDTNITYSDYNAFLQVSNHLPVLGAHDITNIVSFDWHTDPYGFGDFYLSNQSPLIDAGSVTADKVGLYHFTTQLAGYEGEETNSIVDIGYHYVALDDYLNYTYKPVDADGDGIPDYLEDANGNGVVDNGETAWQNAQDLGLRVIITRPQTSSQLP